MEISESQNPEFQDPEPRIWNPESQNPESQDPFPRAYLIPYFFRIFTTGFMIDSAQSV